MTAVIVSGGKQYRVAPGDRILVDRLEAETGTEIEISSVLMLADGDGIRLAAELKKGDEVTARVLGHPRGPKIDVLRYKAKKRVRVHRGARAGLTALEIVAVAGQEAPPPEVKVETEEKPRGRRRRAREVAAEENAPTATITETTENDDAQAAPRAETVEEEPAPVAPRAETVHGSTEDEAAEELDLDAQPKRKRSPRVSKEPEDGA